MYAISIGTENCSESLRERLASEVRTLRDEGLNVQVDEETRGNLIFLDCNVVDETGAGQNPGLLLRHLVAGAVSDVIVDIWEERLLKRMVRSGYYYFNQEEQDTILRYAGRNLDSGDEASRILGRKHQILQRLLEYLDTDSEVVLEGFVTFRLKEYVEELEDAVDRAVDDFLMEKEYTEFIRLLKYFVDAQEPRVEEVHVIVLPGGAFKLVDGQGQALHNEYLEDFVVEMVDSQINYEDLMISSLITIAPSRITLHVSTANLRDEAVETVRSVFGERVTLCRGCELCLRDGTENLSLPHGPDLWNWNLP